MTRNCLLVENKIDDGSFTTGCEEEVEMVTPWGDVEEISGKFIAEWDNGALNKDAPFFVQSPGGVKLQEQLKVKLSFNKPPRNHTLT